MVDLGKGTRPHPLAVQKRPIIKMVNANRSLDLNILKLSLINVKGKPFYATNLLIANKKK